MHYLWRAVDQEGEVLERCVTKARDKKAALCFMKKALKRQAYWSGAVFCPAVHAFGRMTAGPGGICELGPTLLCRL